MAILAISRMLMIKMKLKHLQNAFASILKIKTRFKSYKYSYPNDLFLLSFGKYLCRTKGDIIVFLYGEYAKQTRKVILRCNINNEFLIFFLYNFCLILQYRIQLPTFSHFVDRSYQQRHVKSVMLCHHICIEDKKFYLL